MAFRFEEEPALVDYFEAIKRAVARSGAPIVVNRVDLDEGDYEVTQEVIDRLSAADFVLADFTLGSPNVYFEAGVARGAGKYTLRTARRGTELPFDIGTWRTIFYVNATQLESALLPALANAYQEATTAR